MFNGLSMAEEEDENMEENKNCEENDTMPDLDWDQFFGKHFL